MTSRGFVLALIYFVVLTSAHGQTIDRPISTVLNLADKHKLKSVTISGNDLRYALWSVSI